MEGQLEDDVCDASLGCLRQGLVAYPRLQDSRLSRQHDHQPDPITFRRWRLHAAAKSVELLVETVAELAIRLVAVGMLRVLTKGFAPQGVQQGSSTRGARTRQDLGGRLRLRRRSLRSDTFHTPRRLRDGRSPTRCAATRHRGRDHQNGKRIDDGRIAFQVRVGAGVVGHRRNIEHPVLRATDRFVTSTRQGSPL